MEKALLHPAVEQKQSLQDWCCCRFGLVRVRENAESIAFYNGEASEAKLLFQRLSAVVVNYGQLLVTSRNLSFFTSFYRCARQAQYSWCALNARNAESAHP